MKRQRSCRWRWGGGKRVAPASAGLLLGMISIAFAESADDAEVDPPVNNADINYAVGYQVGGDFRRQAIDLDTEMVLRGVADAMAGGDTLMTQAEMRAALTALQRRADEVRARHAEAAIAERRAASEAFLDANSQQPGIQVTDSGLQYQIIMPGDGRRPGPTDRVRVHYRGTRIDGSEFDSSFGRDRPAEFGLDRVIPGWTEGLQLLREGGKARLFVPYQLAYGEQGRLGNQTLIFDVELIDVVDQDDATKSEASGASRD